MFDSHPASDTPHPDLQDADTEPQTRFQHREKLAREITTLAGHLNAGNYRFLKLLEEFDRDEGYRGHRQRCFRGKCARQSLEEREIM